MQKLPIICLSIGVVVGSLSLLFGFVIFPKIFKSKIAETGKLVNGTDKWNAWKRVPIPVFQKIYIFNVTNPEEVRNGGKPNLMELGPYVYQHKRSKVDISIHDEKDTITYRHEDSYIFRPDLTKGSINDIITVPNIPFLGAVYKSIQAGSVARYLVAELLTDQFGDEDVYVTRTVDQILFGGYYVPFMKELSDLKGEVLMPNNTFGLYYGRNGTISGLYEIMSGVKDPESYARVVSYNGENTLSFFEGGCENIPENAYDGPSQAPFITRDREFYLFIPSLCRHMKFVYQEDVSMNGIPAFKFIVPNDYLEDARSNPKNLCYCSDPGDKESCLKTGVWDLGPCRGGAPMAMSFPHFYAGDEEYLEQSVGLKPDKNKHQMTIVLEPTAAISLQVAMRMQMNMILKPTKYFPRLKKIPEMIHPIFWMDQGVTLPPEMTNMIKSKMIRTQEIVRLGTYFIFGLGIIFVFAGLVIYWCIASSVKKQAAYSPKKASLNKMAASENGTSFIDSPKKANGDFHNSEKYSKVSSPPTLAKQSSEEEEEPFLPQQNNHPSSGSGPKATPVSIPTIPSVSYTPNIPSNPVVKKDENPFGAPFPKEMSTSSNSMNPDRDRDNELDNTLKGINDAVSSYENLKESRQQQ